MNLQFFGNGKIETRIFFESRTLKCDALFRVSVGGDHLIHAQQTHAHTHAHTQTHTQNGCFEVRVLSA